MLCSSCARNTPQSFLKALDSQIWAQSRAGNAISTARAGSLRPLHTESNLPSRLTRPNAAQRLSDSVDLPSSTHKRALYLTKRGVHSLKQNANFSGLGVEGQQAKDLQEHVSSMTMVSEGTPGGKKAAKLKSISSPARLARRERRGPRRRFEGDRTRSPVKRNSLSKETQRVEDREARQVATTEHPRKETFLRTQTVNELEKTNSGPAKALEKRVGKKARWARTAKGLPKDATVPPVIASRLREPVERAEQPKPQKEMWEVQKIALKEKFGEQGWNPRKRLSPDALDGIRTLHAQYPETYSTPVLAEHFKVSPDAIRRILKSKWRPSEEEEEKRKRRWEKRGENIWTDMSKLGIKPPKPWRQKGIGRFSERVGQGRHRSLAALEKEIGTEAYQDVISTRVGETRKPYKSLAQKIF